MKIDIREHELKWLHLSDIHLKSSKHEDYSSEKVLNALLETLRGNNVNLDLIFFTGDLAEKGLDYSGAKIFLDQLLEASGISDKYGNKAKQHLIVVPGNHDIESRDDFLLPKLESTKDLHSFFSLTNKQRDPYFDRMKSFTEFFNNYFDGIRKLDKDHPYISENISLKIQDYPIKIGILGLISTWFSMGSDVNPLLCVGEILIKQALDIISHKDRFDVLFVLQHHPLSLLHYLERDTVRSLITKRADIFLSGHIHENNIVQTTNQFGKLLECSAGAVHIGKGQAKIFRSLYGTLNAEQGNVIIDAIRYSDIRDEWVLDTDYLIPDYDLRNKNYLINRFRRRPIDIPIIVYAMKKLEAQELFNGNVFNMANSPQKDKIKFNRFKKALGNTEIATMINNYFDERDSWRPYNCIQGNIYEILFNTVSRINRNLPPHTYPEFRLKSYTSSIFENTKQAQRMLNRFIDIGGVFIIDAVSLFHPSLRDLFLDLKVSKILSSEQTIIMSFSPYDYRNLRANQHIEELFMTIVPQIIKSFDNDWDIFCEFGLGDISVAKRRIYSAIRPRDILHEDFILEKNKSYIFNNYNIKDIAYNKPWR